MDSSLPTFIANINTLSCMVSASKALYYILEFGKPKHTKADLEFKYLPNQTRKIIKGGLAARLRQRSFRGVFS